MALLVGYQLAYAGRVYPGVTVLDTPLGGLPRDQAEVLVNQRLERYSRELPGWEVMPPEQGTGPAV